MNSKHSGARLLVAAMAAVAAMALAVPIAQAAPAPGYEQFAGCPSPEENSEVTTCMRTDITGGHFKMGNKDVPISNPMTLSGGVKGNLTGFSYNSKGGLTAVKQQVPGGIVGLTGLDWLVDFLSLEGLKLYAVTELAGTPAFTGVETVSLPIKVRLVNPVLGSNCHVGSNSNPITLSLITGTTNPPPPNTPITGTKPSVSIDPATQILSAKGGIFVDNSFAAPGASDCVLTLFGFIPVSLNGVVNLASGLPAAAGTNETTQNFDLSLTSRAKVYP
jgi:hypothetical protein